MELKQARSLAEQLIATMAPSCERIEIAGSIRRSKLQVKDIEIVALPKWIDVPIEDDLFGETERQNELHEWAKRIGSDPLQRVQWIKPGATERVPWMPKPDGKYWRAYLPSQDINVDIFLPESADNFGTIFLIRTGSREFSTGVAMHARRVGMRLEDGWLWKGEKRIATPEEKDVFRELNLAWVEPAGRIEIANVRNAPAEKGR